MLSKLQALSKPVKICIAIAISILAILLIIVIANACIPGYTEEEVVAIIHENIQPQLDEAEKNLELENLSIDIEVVEFYVERKATIFRPGSIWVYINDYIESPSLPDFAEMTLGEDELVKYGLLSFKLRSDYLLYNDIELENYYLNIRRSADYSDCAITNIPPLYKDSADNEYLFSLVTSDNAIYKNGKKIYEIPDKPSNSSSSGSTCKKCGKSASALTAGGYCRSCVDTYYTDYYVDIDGQISTDRPW